MIKTLMTAAAFSAFASVAAHAQASGQGGVTPQMLNNPQTYIGLGTAAQSSDPVTKQQFNQMDQQLRDAGHPGARAYDAMNKDAAKQ